MEKQTVFIKRYPSKGELPKEEGFYITNIGKIPFRNNLFGKYAEYWLEEIELPSEDIIQALDYNGGFADGANFILNHLKSNTNGSI